MTEHYISLLQQPLIVFLENTCQILKTNGSGELPTILTLEMILGISQVIDVDYSKLNQFIQQNEGVYFNYTPRTHELIYEEYIKREHKNTINILKCTTKLLKLKSNGHPIGSDPITAGILNRAVNQHYILHAKIRQMFPPLSNN